VTATRSGPELPHPVEVRDDHPVADLFDLADRIAIDVGGAVCLEDQGGNVLAYSTIAGQPIDQARRDAILSRKASVAAEQDDVYRSMWASTSVIEVRAGSNQLPRLALGLRMGGVPVGAVFAIASSRELPTASERLAAWTTVAAADVFLYKARPNMTRCFEDEAFAALLNESAPAGEPPNGQGEAHPLAVVAFDLPWGSRATRGTSLDRLVESIRRRLSVHCTVLAAVARGPVVYLALTSPLPSDLGRVAKAIMCSIERELSVTLAGGLGRTVSRLEWIARSRADADLALAFQRQRGGRGFVSYSEVAAGCNLVEVAGILCDRPDLSTPAIESLLHEGRRTELAETVVSFLDGFGDVNQVASRLRIHPNTLRYRIRKVKEQNGVDLDDPDVRLLAWLRLKSAEGGRQWR